MSTEISLSPLSHETVSAALGLARRIFPLDFSSIEKDYRGWLEGPPPVVTPDGVDTSRTALFLGVWEGQIVGLTGYYHYVAHPSEGWLEWFGVAPDQRRRGLGKALLHKTMETLRHTGARTLRLWTTTDSDDSSARLFYDRMGLVAEPFSPDFPRTLVYSVALGSSPLVTWEALPDKPPFPALITASTL
ncbi:MAG TPA: GNAT family N-acetyltransferase [Alphaproteobacteria bacterium]|nr:GNAT family N-acetyltransferase [Alphaproteobacteria bacterium]